jgi:dTDP-4-amino-4,6-dideoxygalactose transaminase
MIQISTPSLGDEEWKALREPLESGWLTQGPKVAEFERRFAAHHDVPHALATTSCTTALHLMLAAAGIGPGDEVIVPSFTWVSTANAVLYTGATPVFADIDPVTYNIDPVDAGRRVTKRTKAAIAVHLFGLCADVSGLLATLPNRIDVFEDAACAAGAMLGDQWAGSLGRAAAFSFHPRKSITTGEGGMLTTSDSELAHMAEKLRNHGAEISEEQRHQGPQPYLLPEFNLLGFNYRMTDLQGAIGLVQLAKLDAFIAERDRWARFYEESLSDIPWLQMPIRPESGRHAWQAYVTRVDPNVDRDSVMAQLFEQGISTRPGTHAIHMLGYYRRSYGFTEDSFPHSRDCERQTMALPLHNRMTFEDYERVVSAIHAAQV